MDHPIIHIKASPKQLSKLRNGHKVRISPAIEGSGFNLLIHPSRFDVVSRTFDRGRGMDIQLSPQELVANQEASPQMEGTGIFGKKFDKFLENNGLKQLAYKVGDISKPAVKAALMAGLGAGATALAGTETIASGGLGAGAIPLIYGAAGSLAALGNDYLDNPSKYQSNTGGPKNKIASPSLSGQAMQNHLLNKLGQETGNQYNVLGEANLNNAIALRDRASMLSDRTQQLQNTFNTGLDSGTTPQLQTKLNRGFGLRHHRTHKIGRGIKEVASVGTNGRFVGNSHLPPALLSQPFSANFQFQHFLPPAYQKYSKGGGLYA